MGGETVMKIKKSSSKSGWSNVKSQLNSFDRTKLLGLIQDLYSASKDNRAFLHARFGLGGDVLAPYKKSLARWLRPDVVRSSQKVSVSKALKAISDYKKAVGEPEGTVELLVFYCEQAAGFSRDVGMEGDSWFSSLIRVFEDALRLAVSLPEEQRASCVERLDSVRFISEDFGWGVGDEMRSLWAKYGVDQY
jgi:hypothetical protein